MDKFAKIPTYYMIPDGGGHWLSDDELVFQSERYNCEICIHRLSLNNLASVPRISRSLINPNGPHRPVAALHDALYRSKGVTNGRVFSRKQTDLLFLDAMLSSKHMYFEALPQDVKNRLQTESIASHFKDNSSLTNSCIAYIMYFAVRIGGSWD